MSGVLHVGEVRIAYAVRSSARVRRKRIEATADGVLVVVPEGTPTDEVAAFVEQRRRWVFDAVVAIAVAAAEAAVGLALLIAIFRNRESVNVEDLDLLKG